MVAYNIVFSLRGEPRMAEPLLTVDEVANRITVNLSIVRRWRKVRELKGSPSSLDEIVARLGQAGGRGIGASIQAYLPP